jgi:hypothetical protein
MDVSKVLGILVKGLTALPSLIDAGADIASTIEKMKSVASSAQNGAVSNEQLNELETHLDAQIDDFNLDMP